MSLNNDSDSPLPQLPPRRADSHKGDYGRVLIVGGSRGMAGAPALAGRCALRSGAGLVTLAVPRAIQATVAGFEPAYMTLGCGAEADDCLALNALECLTDFLGKTTAVALGPGIGTAAATVELVERLYRQTAVPLVVDADALNALALNSEVLRDPPAPRILTPHPGEFQRLSGATGTGEDRERASRAAELCQSDHSGQTIVVLKGHRTIVTDGQHYAVNQTGNPGLATGGTGDCLTGILVALVAQGLPPWDAARLGVHLHGLAGDLAADDLGQVSLTATDLVRFLPAAVQKLP